MWLNLTSIERVCRELHIGSAVNKEGVSPQGLPLLHGTGSTALPEGDTSWCSNPAALAVLPPKPGKCHQCAWSDL
jgi:hypothetical protein